jgi:S1-C subfamily serine protease
MNESPLPPVPELLPPAPEPQRRRAVIRTFAALGTVGLAAGVLIGVGTGGGTTVTGQAAPAPGGSVATGFQGWGWSGDGDWPSAGSGWDGSGSSGSGTDGSGSGPTSGTTQTTGTAATAAQSIGVVEIDTVLAYQGSRAAGTGMVLTSDGEVLTNNHVVDGATGITVTVASTGRTYTATVVGTDPGDDVAVLQLGDASGLQTARLSGTAATVGEAVTGVGNAGGTGTLTAAAGTVTALDQAITASDETGSGTEQLSGLIQTDAAIQAGDSGGPLFDTATGEVIGMDTAASGGGAAQGYAIPIATAEAIARQIEAGTDNGTVHQGYPAFLGVSVQDGTGGATVAGVLPGGPAAQAGITAGDVITAVGGTAVTSADQLSAALAGAAPGERARVIWTTAAGAPQSATVVLATGPAD